MTNFFYRVKRNDTIIKISKEFNVPVGVLIYENNLKKEVLEGDVVFIPNVNGQKYIVKPTDTLDSIAEKFGVEKHVLIEKNKSPYFFYGEVIFI